MLTPHDWQALKNGGKTDKNRKLKPSKVRAYAKAMDLDQWMPSNDAMVIDWDGNVINLQHRGEAILKSGKPQLVLVVRGFPPESFHVMDSGAKRTAADVYGIEGIDKPSLINPVVALVLNYQEDHKRTGTWPMSEDHWTRAAFIEEVKRTGQIDQPLARAKERLAPFNPKHFLTHGSTVHQHSRSTSIQRIVRRDVIKGTRASLTRSSCSADAGCTALQQLIARAMRRVWRNERHQGHGGPDAPATALHLHHQQLLLPLQHQIELAPAAVPVAVQQPPSLRFQLLQGLLLRPATAALRPHRLEPSRLGSNHSPLECLDL